MSAEPNDAAIPRATHEGTLQLAGRTIRTYTPEDGRRILDQHDMWGLFEAMNQGAKISGEEAEAYKAFWGGGVML